MALLSRCCGRASSGRGDGPEKDVDLQHLRMTGGLGAARPASAAYGALAWPPAEAAHAMACCQAADWPRRLKLVRRDALHSLLPSSLSLTLPTIVAFSTTTAGLVRSKSIRMSTRQSMRTRMTTRMRTRMRVRAALRSCRTSSFHAQLSTLTAGMPRVLRRPHEMAPIRSVCEACICTPAPSSLSEERHPNSINLGRLFRAG